MSKVIAVFNQKGGVGKTTTNVNLTASLGTMGKKILVLDLDPQGNASTSMGINKRGRMASSYEVLLGEKSLSEAVVWTEVPNFSIIPSSPDLAGAEVELIDVQNREYALKQALAKGAVNYDYVLIDCPPSLSLVTINALVAANAVIVPLQCEFLALEGVTDLIRNINQIKKRFNPTLELQGVVLTMYDKRNNLSQMVEDDVRNYFGKKVYQTVIPRNVRISDFFYSAPYGGVEQDSFINGVAEVETLEVKPSKNYVDIYKNLEPATHSYMHNMDPEQYYDIKDTAWSPYPLFRLNSPIYFKDRTIEPGYYLLTPREHEGNWFLLLKQNGNVAHIIPVYERDIVPEDFYEKHLAKPKYTKAQKIHMGVLNWFGKFSSSKRKEPVKSYLEINDLENNFVSIVVYNANHKYSTIFRTVKL